MILDTRLLCCANCGFSARNSRNAALDFMPVQRMNDVRVKVIGKGLLVLRS